MSEAISVEIVVSHLEVLIIIEKKARIRLKTELWGNFFF